MSLTSFPFFFFFIVSLVIYYVIPQRMRWSVLLVFSILFFLFSSTLYTSVYALVSIVVTALCAKCIGKAKTEKRERKTKIALAAGIAVNAGILILLKYSGFLISNLNLVFSLAHLSVRFPAPQLAAPLGVSFYTFSAMGYLLDTYWGITEPQQSVLKTALFVCYYPQLTSGPITRYGGGTGAL